MIQSFDDKKNVQNFEKRLSDLRTQMKLKGLDGYLVPRADFFQGEYVAPNDERLAFLTGFSGSAGFCCVFTKKAAIFKEGHYPFFELAAKVRSSKNEELASMFMDFILSDEFQNLIPMTNWSYPSAQTKDEWPSVFSNLPRPKSAVYFSENEASEITKQAIEEWRNALSQ